MRAVTWTQVAQYLILIVAYITPVAILSYNVTGNPVPQLVYGQVLQQVTQLENRLFQTPAELKYGSSTVRELICMPRRSCSCPIL
jgi:cation/acetate symporter